MPVGDHIMNGYRLFDRRAVHANGQIMAQSVIQINAVPDKHPRKGEGPPAGAAMFSDPGFRFFYPASFREPEIQSPVYPGSIKQVLVAGKTFSEQLDSVAAVVAQTAGIIEGPLGIKPDSHPHGFLYHTGTLYSLSASFRDVFMSVDFFLFPMMRAHGTW